jgi:hypothetical protein
MRRPQFTQSAKLGQSQHQDNEGQRTGTAEWSAVDFVNGKRRGPVARPYVFEKVSPRCVLVEQKGVTWWRSLGIPSSRCRHPAAVSIEPHGLCKYPSSKVVKWGH